MSRFRHVRRPGADQRTMAGSAGIAVLAVATALAGTGLLAPAAGASRDTRGGGTANGGGTPRDSGGWHLVAAVRVGPLGNASGYSTVLAPSRDDAWVFGGTNPGSAGAPLAAYWDGTGWRRSSLPGGLASFIAAASASSPRNIWAVSFQGGYALRWNGRSWQVAHRWQPAEPATGVTAVSRTDVWLFGASASGPRGVGTWHYNGHVWRLVTGPAAAIVRASALSRRDIWAITAGRRGGAVVHYNGKAWARVRTGRVLAGAQLKDVMAISRRSVWVLALAPRNHHKSGRIALAHWNGTRWIRYAAPARELSGDPLPGRMAPDGHGGVWVTAMTAGRSTAARILHLSRSGGWTQASISFGSGNGISDLALIPGTSSLWGSGGFITPGGGDASIWTHGYVRHSLMLRHTPESASPGAVALRRIR
jgi:hypothetical protein